MSAVDEMDRLDGVIECTPQAVSELVAEIARLRALIKEAGDATEKLAFEMPPPNGYTPRLVMMAQALRRAGAQAMSIPDELRNIRDNLRLGRFGQREIWERQLEKAADEIERLRTQCGGNCRYWEARWRDEAKENERLQAHVESMINAMKADNERLREALQEIVDSIAAVGPAAPMLERARRALEPKP